MIAYMLSQFPSLGDSGISGYSYFFSSYPNPLPNATTPKIAGMLLLLTLQDHPPSALSNLLAPALTHVNTTWPSTFQITTIPEHHPSFYAWFQTHYDTSPAGLNLLVGSRLLPRSALTTNLTQSAAALRQFTTPQNVATAYLVSGAGVRTARPRGGSNGVNPAWRAAYVHATNGVEWAPGDATARAEAVAKLEYSLQGVRALAPDSGAYVNEVRIFLPTYVRISDLCFASRRRRHDRIPTCHLGE